MQRFFALSLMLALAPAAMAQAADDQRQREQAVVAWLRQHAVPIKSIVAGSGAADLQPLKSVLADVRVVGLGEATHGTREFFQFKHRLLEFLAREMGFNGFVLETSYVTSARVNDYVLGGKGDPAAAARNLSPLWRTEEVAALIEWMRGYNQTVPAERRVRFYGMDMQGWAAARVVTEYVQRAAPDKSAGVEQTFEKLGGAIQAAFGGQGDKLRAALPDLHRLIAEFVLQEPVFVQRTSFEEYDRALHALRLVAQASEVALSGPTDARDRFMADNVLHILNRERPGSKLVVWSHNAHVTTGDLSYLPSGKGMGAYLRQALGQRYYAFGFTFDRGSFQAMVNPRQADSPYAEYTVGPAPAQSHDWYFAQAGLGDYWIDFRSAPQSEAVRQWFTTPRGMRWAGGGGVPPDVAEQWSKVDGLLKSDLSKEYDGIIFIEKMTRARPLTAGKAG